MQTHGGAQRFPVIFLWHMHQPEYQVRGRYRLPWTWLHALSAYTDMAEHLHRHPQAHAAVNFTPVLLAQIEDYAERLQRWHSEGVPPGDPLLDALIELPASGAERAALLRLCLPGARNRRSDSVPFYVELAAGIPAGTTELADGPLADLLMGFCMSWAGAHLRDGDARLQALLQRPGNFQPKHRQLLLEVISDTLASVLPRWKALADAGRVELAMSPYYHPLLPLLLDFGSARDAAPGVPLPPGQYPGGRERAHWHLQEGLRRFEAVFGRRPAGCWPSEAALSADSLQLLEDAGFAWTASAQSVLEATQQHHGISLADPFRPYVTQDRRLRCLFRDSGLSDRIGFAYQHWNAADAAADLIGHLERIAAVPGRQMALIALDGENPWEYFPRHGADFLDALYRGLADHPQLRMTTVSQMLADDRRATVLPALRAGSWVHGQLLTWVGHPEKNRAWELLMQAKRRFDASGRQDAAALHALGACEGSDWFWWPGAYNPAPSVADFDALFRAHLAALYELLGEAVPEILQRPFAQGVDHAVAAGGTMQPAHQGL